MCGSRKRCLCRRQTGNWDAERIGQLVSNLVGNAIQHGHDPIVVEAKDMGAVVSLEVRNAGELERRVARRLFEPFVSGRGGERRGLGLGLYIVREVARAHGGSVLVEDTVDNIMRNPQVRDIYLGKQAAA